ncbi:hypothetical protein [Marinobacter sp.]|uniref:hypothetical protein n=1 Tax=Marinobacter sp. TaxID=50741 RepID=UPI001985352F|nr:hypothetical protein [Marinobacter sp.]MBC7191784.1 hypothetical protein [Marinobacter sp.]
MSKVNNLVKAGSEKESIDFLVKYRDELIHEIEVGKNHIEKLNTISIEKEGRQEAIDRVEKKLAEHQNELKAVDSKIKLGFFDLASEKEIKKIKNRRWLIVFFGAALVILFFYLF